MRSGKPADVMSTFAVLAELVVLLAAATAPATPVPYILIDYARVREYVGAPTALVGLSPVPLADARLAWLVVRPDDSVRLELNGRADDFIRPVHVELPHLDVYRAAVEGDEELALAPETLRGLRERGHELAFGPRSAFGARLLQDPHARSALADGVAPEAVRPRFVEWLRDGGVRLHLAVDGHGQLIEFDDLDQFNRASGLALGAADFWREILSFWRERPYEMTGNFVIKAREEATGDCTRALGAPPDPGGTPDFGPE